MRQAESVGITLKEINTDFSSSSAMADVRAGGVRELARRHLREIEARMGQLRAGRKELRDLLSRRVPVGGEDFCPLIGSNRNWASYRKGFTLYFKAVMP